MARTGFQLVDLSPWPLSASFSALGLTSSFIALFCEGVSMFVVSSAFISLFLLIFTCVRWWGDLILESTFLGEYSSYVIRNLRWGFGLFILSEIFFFVSFFWAFVNSSVGEISMQFVGSWPPLGVKPISPWKVPCFNTVVLVGSAGTVTWAHKAIAAHNKAHYSDPNCLKYQLEGLHGLFWTIFLGVCFTALQAYEYYMASFAISDGTYGCTFFMLTGFHGMHVVVGTIFLTVCWFRLYFLHFSFKHHYFGVDAAVVYWHFVDVVWILVFSLIYIWGYWGYC